MENLQMKNPEEFDQESSFGKKFLRFGAVFLCLLFGFALILLGYLFAIFLELDLRVFLNHTSACFLVCFTLWALVGILTPFDLFQRFSEAVRSVTVERVIVIAVIFGTVIILHWYLINIIVELITSVFSS